jgi:hypothetical protein
MRPLPSKPSRPRSHWTAREIAACSPIPRRDIGSTAHCHAEGMGVTERPIHLCASKAAGLVETCPGAADSKRKSHSRKTISRQAPQHAKL